MRLLFSLYTLLAVALGAVSWSGAGGADKEPPQVLAELPKNVPSPKDNPTSAERVALGKQLFFDPRLSGDNTMSCATCHIPNKAFADGLKTGKGHRGKVLGRNTPTVLNTAFFQRLTWDGRAGSLEEQALGPVTSPDEMNQDLAELEKELNAVPGYVSQFRKVFGTKVTRDRIAKALAAFQRTLVTRNSPFDKYIAGDKTALSESAKRGLDLFKGAAGCVRCHNGPLLSDGKFYRLGVSFRDKGLGAVSKKTSDNYKFRTPSLRNIAQTGPYMHNGSMKTLADVVRFYWREVPESGPGGLVLDIDALSDRSFDEAADVVAFLESLSGEVPRVTPPKLPK